MKKEKVYVVVENELFMENYFYGVCPHNYYKYINRWDDVDENLMTLLRVEKKEVALW